MNSHLAWLDASRDEQRRVRELLNMFSQTESRDELGIGQIRDVFSDLLFPGTSVLLTRARYLLFVPWCHMEGTRRANSSDVSRHVATVERQLLVALKDSGFTEGLIGRRAGPAVKTLPSVIYASALRHYGISNDAALDSTGVMAAARIRADGGEIIDRPSGPWHPGILALPPPRGFPREMPDGFDLSLEEAGWLRERLLNGSQDSMLAHLLEDAEDPDLGSFAPWEDPACLSAPKEITSLLEHAQLFSLAIHGAALLYNLLLAEHYEAAGFTQLDDPSDTYRNRLEEWSLDCAREPRFAGWDREAFWQEVQVRNPRVSVATSAFVNTWLDAVTTDTSSVADNTKLRQVIESRERTQKKAQARLGNTELLRRWNGASGTRQLTYRWQQARRLVLDIRAGLDGARAAA
jgi:hypothetical protein